METVTPVAHGAQHPCPSWCDAWHCTRNDALTEHRQPLAISADRDVTIRLYLARADERMRDRLVVGQTTAYLEITSGSSVVGVNGREVPQQCPSDLTAEACRRLAAGLLDAAERLDTVGGAR